MAPGTHGIRHRLFQKHFKFIVAHAAVVDVKWHRLPPECNRFALAPRPSQTGPPGAAGFETQRRDLLPGLEGDDFLHNPPDHNLPIALPSGVSWLKFLIGDSESDVKFCPERHRRGKVDVAFMGGV